MKLIDLLPPQQRGDLRRLRKRIAKRQYMRRVREQRKLLCVGVDLPIDAGTCGRFVHAGYQRCIHCTRRRWWLLNCAFNPAEVSVAAMLEEHAPPTPTLSTTSRGGCSPARSTLRRSPPPQRSKTARPRATLSTASRRPSRFSRTSPIPACAGEVPTTPQEGSQHGNHLPSRPRYRRPGQREAAVALDHLPAIQVDAPNVDVAARLAVSHHIDSWSTPPSTGASFGLVVITPAPCDPKVPHHDFDEEAEMCSLSVEYWPTATYSH